MVKAIKRWLVKVGLAHEYGPQRFTCNPKVPREEFDVGPGRARYL